MDKQNNYRRHSVTFPDEVVGIIMGTKFSKRSKNKNWVSYGDAGEISGVEHVVNIMEATQWIDNIVVSTEVCPHKLYARHPKIHIAIRPDSWQGLDGDTVTGLALEQYEEISDISNTLKPYQLKIAIVMYGTAIFWRPSWIRQAIRFIDSYAFGKHEKASIRRIDAQIDGCYAFRIGRYEAPGRTLIMPHHGINIDINEPIEVYMANHARTAIQQGTYQYPLKEEVHETHPYITEVVRQNGLQRK